VTSELVTRVPFKEDSWKSSYLYTFNELKAEMEKPFEEKLARTKQLIRLFAGSPNTCVSCSFGKDSIVVLYLALEVNPKIAVNFNNTLIEFPETVRLAKRLVGQWSLNLSELRPEKGVCFRAINERILRQGLRMDDERKHSNICCYHLKEKPLKLWCRQAKITKSITGITAFESRNRFMTACQKGTDYFSYKSGLYKIHPILFWSPGEVWDFTKDMGLPVNEAYGKYGLDRIGCMWCMSHIGWRDQVYRINPKMYCYMMKNWLHCPSIADPSYRQEATEVYA
jgi:phosphoadenosine phosphosulfate reductase